MALTHRTRNGRTFSTPIFVAAIASARPIAGQIGPRGSEGATRGEEPSTPHPTRFRREAAGDCPLGAISWQCSLMTYAKTSQRTSNAPRSPPDRQPRLAPPSAPVGYSRRSRSLQTNLAKTKRALIRVTFENGVTAAGITVRRGDGSKCCTSIRTKHAQAFKTPACTSGGGVLERVLNEEAARIKSLEARLSRTKAQVVTSARAIADAETAVSSATRHDTKQRRSARADTET